MVKAMVVHEVGGPEVLTYEDVEVGDPGPGQIRIRHGAIGVNMSDSMRRRGAHKLPLPLIVGSEGAGTVTAVGEGVDTLKVGDRVGYGGPLGSYVEERLLSADKVIKLPDAIDDRTAAAMMLKGLTVHYLLFWTYPVQRGDTVLIHAAAGGIGTIFCQWAKHLGATVIGTVGTKEKAALAAAHGCDHPILYTETSFREAVMDITGGEGVHAVYDSVGKDTFLDSIACARPRGVIASFGAASGPLPLLDMALLSNGSKMVARCGLADYTATREMIDTAAGRLLEVVGSGAVKIEVNQTYPLAEAAKAHADLEGRRTTGSTVLIP